MHHNQCCQRPVEEAYPQTTRGAANIFGSEDFHGINKGYRTSSGVVAHSDQPQLPMRFMLKPTVLAMSWDWLHQKGDNLLVGKEQVIVAAYLCWCMERCQPKPRSNGCVNVWKLIKQVFDQIRIIIKFPPGTGRIFTSSLECLMLRICE